jgi:hypothetical protein
MKSDRATWKIISVFGIAISVCALVRSMTSDVASVVLSGVLTMFLCTVMLIFDMMINDKAHKRWYDRFVYMFSRNEKKYNVLLRDVTYEFIDKTHMRYRKFHKIKSNMNGLSTFEDRYMWLSDEAIEIVPLYPKQRIKYKWNNNFWDYFCIDLGDSYFKNDVIETGAVLNNLVCQNYRTRLFLSCGIYYKTKKLSLTVKLPPDFRPINGEFLVYRNYDDGGSEIYREQLQYSPEDCSFKKEVMYPRKGRRYLIRWDLDETRVE